jgi:hypothetical protein
MLKALCGLRDISIEALREQRSLLARKRSGSLTGLPAYILDEDMISNLLSPV